jgi:hypothetical protein
MRLLSCLALGSVLACTSPDETFVEEQFWPLWVEWPAEVRAGQPLDVRIVAYAPNDCGRSQLMAEVQRGEIAVTVRARWLLWYNDENSRCIPYHRLVDTVVAVTMPPFTADRSYSVQMVRNPRLAAENGARSGPPEFSSIGTVLVRATEPLDTDRTNGSGFAEVTAEAGCYMLRVPMTGPVPLANAPAAPQFGLAIGYFFTPDAPLCGVARVFHLSGIGPPPPTR